MTHGDLVNICLMHVSPMGLCWGNSTGAGYIVHKLSGGRWSVPRWLSWGFEGSPDILACIKGRFVGIECKVKYDKIRKPQGRFRKVFEKNGGIYIETRSVDDIDARLKVEGLL
ncbi:MAG: hypothetical protein ABJC88_16845 [Parasphingorhabdus sp.]|uniref:hypothetical protein n=1 Tax=Sphingomonadales TaxID=204457 RepID=UPI003262FE5E